MSSKALLALVVLVGCNAQAQEQEPEQEPDVHYVPTPQPVVDRMLELAEIDDSDVVYDLGSGDGRIVITAAKEYGARGVGIDIDPERIAEARDNAREAGVSELVEFRQADLFETDLSEATAVTLYLLPSLNLKLRPKLLRELEPGTPVVSHAFDMGDWQPEHSETVGGNAIHLWIVPERAEEATEPEMDSETDADRDAEAEPAPPPP